MALHTLLTEFLEILRFLQLQYLHITSLGRQILNTFTTDTQQQGKGIVQLFELVEVLKIHRYSF
jgi:hypothetical protein